jgi:hypothetical protein
MKNLLNLTQEEKLAILEQHTGIKYVVSEQGVPTSNTTQQPVAQPLMNENAVKSCLDGTYGKGRGIGKTAKGGLIYNLAGLVTVFYLNGRYLAEYTKTKGNFNCSSGRAVLTPDPPNTKPTTPQATKPATQTTTPQATKPATQTTTPQATKPATQGLG